MPDRSELPIAIIGCGFAGIGTAIQLLKAGIDSFTIFERALQVNDLVRPGPAYLMTWGRRHSQAAMDILGEKLDADLFLLGHQPQPDGWKRAADNLLILASDHNHGYIAPLSLERPYNLNDVISQIVPLTSIA